MLTLIIFIAVLGVLVLVHEFGHFFMAKRAGMKVEEFGFGFPPRLFSYRPKGSETTYSINWIPFGGFVKILGEDQEDNKRDPRSFSNKSIGARSSVIVAGVVMNLILAFGLLSIGGTIGLRQGLGGEVPANARDLKVQIGEVAAGSPAAEAGLRPLDEIVGFQVDGRQIQVKDVETVQKIVNENRGRTLMMNLRRGTELLDKNIVPRVDPPPGQGAMGVSLFLTGVIKYPWPQAIYRGALHTFYLTTGTLEGFARLIGNAFIGKAPGEELSGPVGIAQVTGQAARVGWAYLLQFVALLSVNLAVLNIIPFPALDGGRLLFLFIEKVKGSPLSRKAEQLANAIGFYLLILLMIYVTTKDILKFL